MILFSRNLKEKNLDCQVQVQQAGMTGVITPDRAVPYLDDSYYRNILFGLLLFEMSLADYEALRLFTLSSYLILLFL